MTTVAGRQACWARDCDDDGVTGDPRQTLLAAIGGVAMDSGSASIALQQVAEAVTGTGLIYFTLRDATLGTQVKQVRELVAHATTNEWITHPPVDVEMREVILSTLKMLDPFLVSLRNRVIHDVWDPEPSPEHPDGVRGHRATRWGKGGVETTVTTLHLIGSTFFLVACTLGAAARAMDLLREHDRDFIGRLRDNPLQEATKYHRELRVRTHGIQSGTQEGWLWVRR